MIDQPKCHLAKGLIRSGLYESMFSVVEECMEIHLFPGALRGAVEKPPWELCGFYEAVQEIKIVFMQSDSSERMSLGLFYFPWCIGRVDTA